MAINDNKGEALLAAAPRVFDQHESRCCEKSYSGQWSSTLALGLEKMDLSGEL
jgi:hypothetical protein